VADSPLHGHPAQERYAFTATATGTRLDVQLQSWDASFTDFVNDSWPRALKRLKALSESTH
jgi:hypothetical protein